MRNADGPIPPTVCSRASFAPSKRKGSPIVKRTHHQTRRRRLVSVTETRTPVSETDQVLRSCSNIEHDYSSLPRHKKHEKKKRRKLGHRDDDRRWVFSSRASSSYKDKFVFVSYNILGVENASKHPDLYYQVSPQFLNWDWRKKLICKELSHYNPSILCLQEVDRFNDLADLLEEYGFRGVYKARTGEAHDGCAIFWKEELFTLLHLEDIEFQKFGLRDNVAQFCVLKMNLNIKNSSENGPNDQMSKTTQARSLLIGNIHMLFNPNRGDIKLGQIRLFLEKAHAISQEWGSIPVVIAGDLNSVPQSALYHYLASSELDILKYDRRKISGQVEYPLGHGAFKFQNNIANRPFIHPWSEEELQIAGGCDGVTLLRHNLKLSSAYKGIPGSRRTRDTYGEPLVTSYHSKFMGTVDYIWHSEELIPLGVVETLPVDVLRKTRGLPSKKWGSDHLALVCELAFTDDHIKDLKE